MTDELTLGDAELVNDRECPYCGDRLRYHPDARPCGKKYPSWDYRSVPIPPAVERAITTPHDHECLKLGDAGSIYAGQPCNRPLWLIWKREPLGRSGQQMSTEMDFPRLDSVADNEASARAHYCMAAYGRTDIEVYVERVPANHRFASSLGEWQMQAHMALWKIRAERNKREGD